MPLKLHDHQKLAVDKLKDGCVLWGGVGTGKTITALAYYFKHHKERSLYVITTARKRDSGDWKREFNLFGKKGDIVTDSWNNIEKYKDVKDAFFIFDEQRLVGKGAWVKTFLYLAKRNKWILLSATPGDTWMDYCPVFVANGFYKNRTDFIRRHVVYKQYSKFPSIDRYVDTGILQRYRKSILVHMPYQRRTTRHLKTITVQHDADQFKRVKEQRWNIYEKQPLNDVGEMFRVMRKLVNSDVSRLGAVRELWTNHPRLIIFYNFDYELEMLRDFFELMRTSGEKFDIAEWNGHKHEEVPVGERWVYLVQYSAGAEAWNCVSTNAMVFYSLNYSYKIFEQAQGRIDRLNTEYSDLYYYILRSNSFIDHAIWRSLLEKKNFNERDFAGSMSF